MKYLFFLLLVSCFSLSIYLIHKMKHLFPKTKIASIHNNNQLISMMGKPITEVIDVQSYSPWFSFCDNRTVLMFMDTKCMHCSIHLEDIINSKNEFRELNVVVIARETGDKNTETISELFEEKILIIKGTEATFISLNISIYPTFMYVDEQQRIRAVSHNLYSLINSINKKTG
jgi:rRNA pseudouridine-1189 N-methylase Emg1 (Nep1/Mra1 family)